MLDARFIAAMQAIKSEGLQNAFIAVLLLMNNGPVVRCS
jgi:hypothetical protein